MPANPAQNPTPRNQPATEQQQQPAATKPKKKNRNRKRRNRRQSFIASEDSGPIASELSGGLARPNPDQIQDRVPFYRGRNLSNTSLESDALLDHRDQPMMRPRRESRLSQSFRPESFSRAGSYFPSFEGPGPGQQRSNFRYQQNIYDQGGIDEDEQEGRHITDRTPLITPLRTASPSKPGYGTDSKSPFSSSAIHRRPSTASSPLAASQEYDVNNPPSVPGSPTVGATDMGYDDAMVTGLDFPAGTRSPEVRRSSVDLLRDAVINMEGGGADARKGDSRPPSPPAASPDGLRRRRTIAVAAEEDVCFPSEIPEDFQPQMHDLETGEKRRRRRREWPDLSVLEEWSREEKEEQSLEYRVKKISEPVLVGGRLRPQYIGWRREEEDAPYRFTYFNEEFQSTIHAQTISELVQPGGGFRDLFIPDPPELEDSSDDEEDLISLHDPPSNSNSNSNINQNSQSNNNYLASSMNNESTPNRGTNTPVHSADARRDSGLQSNNNNNNRSETQTQTSNQPDGNQNSKPKRYGPRPTWWLDVLCPTDAEMRVISKAFGIHALTAEDIMMQEAREKVELFRNYYFLNYRTFEQDPNSDNHLEPVNMYVVVFREGCLSFHFSQTPHPANVRRRIRQLRDYLILSSDWISYALIDDITDVFGPLIQTIENEVDEVDDTIMGMHNTVDDYSGNNKENGKGDPNNDAQSTTSIAPGEMLRRVGECRKKVMGMYRLLSNKADVIKGFAKRCNEQWEVAPKSEIGLYLGDIQDHIMTMTSNLTHYETLLSRAHSNYLAQINILMNERQERTADVLGKLTVLGTIVLPMNIICVTAGLVFFGVASFLIAKRVYRIV
uniref:Putative metal ion transporter C27B12.12c n=1 Tax=Talaromyces marneffei PM1 TaxID=1077442 RepID=A0A093XQE4_TALMA